MVIALCGPHRFGEEMWDKYLELTAEGHICLLPAFNANIPKSEKKSLHKKKIDMSDAIYVVNVNGYFGDDTDNEIRYAMERNKRILWYEPRCQSPGLVYDRESKHIHEASQD